VAAESAELKQPRLSAATVGVLAGSVARPRYDRDRHGCGIVHLGVGAFMRAHIAVYCDQVLGTEGGDWAITGVSLRRPDVQRQLNPQDGLYLVGIRGEGKHGYRLVGALKDVSLATEDPGALVARLAGPQTRIVSVTVTEKGYCADTHRGGLDERHPAVLHDLAAPRMPASLIGILHAACLKRRDDGAGGLSILSCDNLPGNGQLLRRAVLDFAALTGGGAAGFIRDNVRFPSTMVDRIVPATAGEDIVAAARHTGVYDAGLVCTEPFTQWVIEHDFANGRPAWETAGALLVADVAPYETAKLRLLNGAHSTCAYLGYLAGHEFVHEVMADSTLARFVEALMREEISPVTPAPAGMEHERYIPDLLERFRNRSLNHRTQQIAMDGSQKLPQRLLATIRLQLERGGPIDGLSLAVAAWMRYVLGTDELGNPIEVSDPLSSRFAAIADECGHSPGALVDRFLGLQIVFGNVLPGESRFRRALLAGLESLLQRGSRAAAERWLATRGGQ
jgi:fructuronate reductase